LHNSKEGRNLLDKYKNYFASVENGIRGIAGLLTEEYKDREMQKPRYQDPKQLNRYEHKVFSQNGEDGIIEEILSRIGTENKFFVEFGVENGLESNSLFLLLKDFSGCWIEANNANFEFMREKYRQLIGDKRLTIVNGKVTAENIEEIFLKANIPKSFDVLSIDIDGNDYYVWEAIKIYRPRLVVVEYNSRFPASTNIVIKYDPEFCWQKTNYFGASLKALEILANKKGYKLVGCDFKGVNAFFVRDDLIADKFVAPYTAETHYQPTRYFLMPYLVYPPDYGAFTKAT
jgi:hypothetical protein